MRILYLCQHFPPETGAPQTRVYEVSRELMRRGHRVEVVTAFPHRGSACGLPQYRSRLYMLERWGAIPVRRSWIYAARGAHTRERIASYLSFTASALIPLMLSRRPDVLICNSPPLTLGVTGYVAARLWGAKFVFNVADIWPRSAVELGALRNGSLVRLLERLEHWLYAKSYAVAVATEGIARHVVGCGKAESAVFLLPNGVDTELFRPLPRDEPLCAELGLAGKTVFLYAGNLGRAQGLESILQAARLVMDALPGVRFLFLGDGTESKRLRQISHDLGLRNVAFHCAVATAEMPRYFSCSDFSIVPLRSLPLFRGARPSKIFPSLATATPVLYCGEGEGADIIERNQCGIVARPEDAASIAGAVAKLASLEAGCYELMASNARRLAVHRYSWRHTVDELLVGLGLAAGGAARHSRLAPP